MKVPFRPKLFIPTLPSRTITPLKNEATRGGLALEKLEACQLLELHERGN